MINIDLRFKRYLASKKHFSICIISYQEYLANTTNGPNSSKSENGLKHA